MRFVLRLFDRFPLLSLSIEDEAEYEDVDYISNTGGMFDLATAADEEEEGDEYEEDSAFGFARPR